MSLESEILEIVCEDVVENQMKTNGFINKKGCYYHFPNKEKEVFTAQELVEKVFDIADEYCDKDGYNLIEEVIDLLEEVMSNEKKDDKKLTSAIKTLETLVFL